MCLWESIIESLLGCFEVIKGCNLFRFLLLMDKTIKQSSLVYECRNVEGLRRNWEAIRREQREFGQRSEDEQVSSDEDPTNSMSLADRASILRAKRILEERKSQQSESFVQLNCTRETKFSSSTLCAQACISKIIHISNTPSFS